MFQSQPLSEFLDRLAARDATPGGGSAAAVMGAMGAALVSMVCNLTIGKAGYEAEEAAMRALRERAEALRRRLTDMIQADVAAFEGVMAAYGMPRNNDQEKAVRATAIQNALHDATDVPLACARDCLAVIELCRTAGEKGNRNAVSDAGVGVAAALAALKSAALNVYINIGSIKDEAFARERRAAIEELLARADTEADAVYEMVVKALRA